MNIKKVSYFCIFFLATIMLFGAMYSSGMNAFIFSFLSYLFSESLNYLDSIIKLIVFFILVVLVFGTLIGVLGFLSSLINKRQVK